MATLAHSNTNISVNGGCASGGVLFRLAFFMRSLLRLKPDDQTVATPKLNVVAMDQALRLLNRLGIVVADHRLEAYEVPVVSDGKRPIICHP
jgi:hypothetical protein